MTMTPNEIYKKAVSHYGLNHQLIKLAEECAELAVECHHMADGRSTVDRLAGEIADVEILISQIYVAIPEIFAEARFLAIEKADRLERRILERE